MLRFVPFDKLFGSLVFQNSIFATKKQLMMQRYDILIIGGGPIGLACGLAAKKAHLSYIIIEKGALVNSLYNYPANMTFFSTSDRLEIGDVPFVSSNVKPTRSESLEYYRRVAESQALNIHLFEEVQDVQKARGKGQEARGNEQEAKGNEHYVNPANSEIQNETDTEGCYLVKTSKNTYLAQHIILATGFYDIPNRLNIVGEDLPKVTHYYKEPHFYYNQKVVVVGSNNSSVDAALETYRKGADVTMVIRKQEVGHRVKYWVRPDIVNRITEGSIKAYFESHLVAIRPDAVDIQTPEGLITLDNDFVIAATGYQPNFAFLKKIGIQLSDNEKLYPSYDTMTQLSNMPNIYLAGVVCGGMDTHVWFIENSRIHAETIVAHICAAL
jgi:thioredoxin reductase (NADPH)